MTAETERKIRATSARRDERFNGVRICSPRFLRFLRILPALLFFIVLPPPVRALTPHPGTMSVVLAWDASSSPGVTSYRIYYGASSGNYTNSIVAGNVTSLPVPGLVSGVTYYFAVTAGDAGGLESSFSEEVSFTPLAPHLKIRVTAAQQVILTVRGFLGQAYDIQATKPNGGWTVIGTVTIGISGSETFLDPNRAAYPQRFYRLVARP